MFARFACGLLAVALAFAAPAVAQGTSGQDDGTDEVQVKAAGVSPSGLQAAAYDVILVPRPRGARRSRMFNGERWVTLPPMAGPGQTGDRYRGSDTRWTQRGARSDMRGASRDWRHNRDGEPYQPRGYRRQDDRAAEYAPRYRNRETWHGNGWSAPSRYHTSDQRYLAN